MSTKLRDVTKIMSAWSEVRKPTHDKPAEITARSILTTLRIPWEKYHKFYRLLWRCRACGHRYESAEECKTHTVVAPHLAVKPDMEQMYYETDLLLWDTDVVELDGIVHKKGKQPKRDLERDDFLRSLGLIIHRFPNKCLLQHPEVFADWASNLKELRMLQQVSN